jgi:hypothetical protein
LVDRRHRSPSPLNLRETPIGFATSFEATAHPLAMHEAIHAKRNRANRSLLSGKRFDATEDRDQRQPITNRPASTEVMHPKSIARDLAQENDYRSGTA